jgi:hypothetical protein
MTIPTPSAGGARVRGSPGLDARVRGLLRLAGPLIPLLFAAGWLAAAAWPGAALPPVAARAGLLLACAAAALYVALARPRVGHYIRGAAGEEETARTLARLPAGHSVFHGVRLAFGAPDADHVVLTPAGMFVIETKNWTGEVHVEGGRILVNGRTPDRPPLAQVRRAADRVRGGLERALHLRLPVQPVLCFLGEGLEPPMTGCGGVIVCRIARLAEALNAPPEVPWNAADRTRVEAWLNRHAGDPTAGSVHPGGVPP